MTCQQCGDPIGPRKPTESEAVYAARKYCSRRCAAIAGNAKRTVHTTCTVDGCDRKAIARGLCNRCYFRAYRNKTRRPPTELYEPPPKRKPVTCVFCEAARVCASRGYSDAETAAAMRKPAAWIRHHIEECTREKRTA